MRIVRLETKDACQFVPGRDAPCRRGEVDLGKQPVAEGRMIVVRPVVAVGRSSSGDRLFGLRECLLPRRTHTALDPSSSPMKVTYSPEAWPSAASQLSVMVRTASLAKCRKRLSPRLCDNRRNLGIAAIVLNDELAIRVRGLAGHGRQRMSKRIGTIESRHNDGQQRHGHSIRRTIVTES